jgi:IS5 family transposase
MIEELIYGRISFRRFLNITANETILDETAICKFCNGLIQKGLLEVIFNAKSPI